MAASLQTTKVFVVVALFLRKIKTMLVLDYLDTKNYESSDTADEVRFEFVQGEMCTKIQCHEQLSLSKLHVS